jgi:hypothetical protein
MNLITRRPKRLFTFGCSFTGYAWSMWPEIIAYDLDIPLYNFGKTGAGNQYIANTVSQANARYCFNKDDLVIVCWTNVCREDRWKDGEWILPGNIFTQDVYNQKWVQKWADPLGYIIRDLGSIHLVNQVLSKSDCQHHFLSMLDVISDIDQWNLTNINFKNLTKMNPNTGQETKIIDDLLNIYHKDIKKINKSFYDVLWNGNIQLKISQEQKRFSNLFDDGHPWPDESLCYLESVFSDHRFKDKTKEKTLKISSDIINEIKNLVYLKNKKYSIWGLPENVFEKIHQTYCIANSEYVNLI